MKFQKRTDKFMESDVKEYDYEAAGVSHPVFDKLYDKYQNEVFSFACYLTKDRGDAEDLYQEAWLRVIKNLPEKVNMQRIKAWIFTIVVNLYRDGLRKKRIRRLFLLEKSKAREADGEFPFLVEKPAADSTDHEFQAEIGKDISLALDSLPERQRRVFVLKEIAGFQQTEISEILAVPVGTVKSLMYRAVKKLRLELSKYKIKSNTNEEIKCGVKTSSA